MTVADPSARSRSSTSSRRIRATLQLLGSFEARIDGRPVPLPMSAQRLLAFLALHAHSLSRVYVAGQLWLQSTDDRAAASLRSALWRIHQVGPSLIEPGVRRLRLDPSVRVDFLIATETAHAVIHGRSLEAYGGTNWSPLASDLLPDWYEEWVLVEQERYRQLCLQALETLSARLAAAGHLEQALEVILAAIGREPLRESAYRMLVQFHLEQGNAAEAVRQYRFYCALLRDRLGLGPSPRMQELVRPLGLGGATRSVP